MKANMLRVWIQGPGGGDIRAMLAACKTIAFKGAPTIEAADMVLYTGGADVNPLLYGQEKMDGTCCDLQRDRKDQDCFIKARSLDKFQVGICRGSQFLNVMCGGELWQDVDRHALSGSHLVEDLVNKTTFFASSTHHQQAILGPKGVLLAYGDESTKKRSPKGNWVKGMSGESIDVEAFWYPDHRCLGVQWHPEWGPEGCTEVFFEYVERYRNSII